MASLRSDAYSDRLKKSVKEFENNLCNAGMPPGAAEIQARATAELIDSLTYTNLATKDDIKSVIERMEKLLIDLELKMTMRLGSLLLGSIALVSYLKHL